MTPTGKPAQIMDALFTRAGLMESEGPELPVSLPEQAPAFEPPADNKYLVVAVFPNRPRWEGVTAGKIDQGLLQVTVVWPRNLGLIGPAEAVALVEQHFAKNTALQSGETRVRVSAEPWHGQPLTDADTVSVPVTIPWTA